MAGLPKLHMSKYVKYSFGNGYETLCGKLSGDGSLIATDTLPEHVTCKTCLQAMRKRA